MKFGALVGAARAAKDPESTRVSDAYFAYITGERNLADEARALTYILTKYEDRVATGQRDRTKSWSASSAGKCGRAQQFSWLGMPGERKPDEHAQNIFLNGDYLHLRWQVAGLVGGFLRDAEVPLTYGPSVRGTMDGWLSWGEVLELKSINDRGFQNVVEFGPKTDHKWQATAYMLATGMTATRFVYENKNTNSVKEYLFELDETMALEVRSQWQLLDERTESKTLFPMLHDCLNQRGPYRWCPFSAICEEATWPSA